MSREAAHVEVLSWANLDAEARAALEGDNPAELRLLALDLLAERRAVNGGRCCGCDERIDAGQRYESPWPVYASDCCLPCAEACYATGLEPDNRNPESPWYQARFGGAP